jgi:hypothetical protein
MIRRLFFTAVIAVLAGAIVRSVAPDIQRYLKIREM